MNDVVMIPIGDWSNDGHGRCAYFYFKVNKSLQDLRQGYFDSCEAVPEHLRPEEVCGDYEESYMTQETYDDLVGLFPALRDMENTDDLDFDDNQVSPSQEFMAELVMNFIKLSVPDLVWTYVEDPPMLPFYGYKKFNGESQHIGFVGYGLFD